MASKYWVGGTANWDSTAGTKWATTSGGAGGAAAPTAADDVFFDGNSGTGTVTTTSSSVCRSLNFTGYTGGFTVAGQTLNIGDGTAGASNIALKLVSGMTLTINSASASIFAFVSTSATVQTIDMGGKAFGSMVFNGAGGSWQFTSAVTSAQSGSNTITLTAGTLDTNGQTITTGRFVISGTSTRTLTLGASTINLATNSGGNGVWDATTTTNLTFNVGTSTIAISPSDNTTFAGGGLTYNTVSFGTARVTISGTNTFANLTLTDGSASCALTLAADQTVTGTFTCNVASTGISYRVISSAMGTPRTITAAAVNLQNINFQDITGAGAAAPFTGTNIGDAGGISGITATPARTVYWVAGAGGSWSATSSWSLTSGGASGANQPLPQDTVIFDANSITSPGATITGDVVYCGKDIDFTGVLNSPILNNALSNNNFKVCGSLTLVANMSLLATGASKGMHFEGRGSHFITSAGLDLVSSFNILSFGGTYNLTDAIFCSATATSGVTNGTFDANGFNVTCPLFNSSNSNVRTIKMGSGTWTLTGTGTVWTCNTSTNLTFDPGTSTIVISNTSASNKAFAGGNLTYNDLTITGGGSGTISSFSGNNIFRTLTIGAPKTVVFTAGNTQTVSAFIAVGSAGNVITLQSSSGTNFTLSKAGGIVRCDYLSIADSTATGGALWYAGANSTDAGGGNSGWIFTAAPATGGGGPASLLGV